LKRREDEEEDVSSNWMSFRKLENSGNWKRKHEIALCGELVWKRLWDCPKPDNRMRE